MPLLKQWKENEKIGIKLLKVGLQLILTNAYGTNKILSKLEKINRNNQYIFLSRYN